MGWTGYINDTRKAVDIVRAELEWTSGEYKVIANSGSKYWVVEKTSTGERFAVVALVERKHGDTYTKIMDESMGPNDCNMPTRLLNMLTPTEHEYAIEWRRRARALQEKKQATPKLKPGDTIVFDEPVVVTAGWSVERLEYIGKYLFRDSYGRRVRLHKTWKTYYKWRVEN